MFIKNFRRVFLLSIVFIPANLALAQAELQTCIDSFDQANDQIADGFFDEAIALLEPCGELEGFDATQQTTLFKLLADAYLAKRYVSEARDAIAKILDISPNFAPDVNLDSQLFRNLVAELQQERSKPAPLEGFNATVDNGNVRLSWSTLEDPDDEISQIRILRGSNNDTLSPIDSVSIEASGYTDTQATPGSEYVYTVQSVGNNGVASDRANIASVSIPAPVVTEAIPTEPISAKKPSSKRKPLLIGGGVLIAGGIVAAIALSGGDDNPDDPIPTESLPGPPSIP